MSGHYSRTGQDRARQACQSVIVTNYSQPGCECDEQKEVIIYPVSGTDIIIRWYIIYYKGVDMTRYQINKV